MLHLLAWSSLIGQTADSDMTPVPDPVFLVQNGHFVPSVTTKLYWAWAASATLSRAKFASPKTRVVTNPFIRPINVATLPANNPNVAIYIDSPFNFNALEELQMLATSALAMGTERFTALALVGSGIDPAPQGDYYNLRWTSTTAATANAWSQLAVTFQDTLPAGTYAAVHVEHFSTNAQACRLIFNGQQYRPGSISVNALANRQNLDISTRQCGVLGRFIQTAMPIMEVLCNGADNSHEGYLQVVRVG